MKKIRQLDKKGIMITKRAITYLLLSVLLFAVAGCGGCGGIDDEVRNVSVSIRTTGRIDSSSRVEHIITIKNNSKKTLVSGSYRIRSVDISGRGLGYDAVYPKDIRSGGTRTADVWLKLPPSAKVYGEWQRARFK